MSTALEIVNRVDFSFLILLAIPTVAIIVGFLLMVFEWIHQPKNQ